MRIGLEPAFAALRAAGRKAFVPYVTAGLPGVDADLLRALEQTGADAVEVGIPFSDPVMDGPVIQEASRRAVEAGTTAAAAFALVAEATLGIPVLVMTYLNPVLARGLDRFAGEAVSAGVSGAIVPDLPVDEAGPWLERCRAQDLASVFLAAPNTSQARLQRIADASRGFVYCVSSFGVTGARGTLAGSAERVVGAIRPLTERALLVGVGISSPEQASAACVFADGVVVGTALVEPLLDGDREGCLARARSFRAAAAG